MVTKEEAESYYRRKQLQHNVVKAHAKKRKLVVYGARASNAHLPSHLDKPTNDWDIFSPHPKKSANRVEKKLDRAYGGDYYRVEPALHEGTYKVKSNVTNEGIADYTKPDKQIPTKKIRGVSYATLEWIKKQKRETLKDKDSKYRHDKDKETLQRIKIHETKKKVKPRRRTGVKFGFPLNRLR